MVEFKFIEYGTDFGTRDMGMKLREKLLPLIKENDKVVLVGFGTFKTKKLAARSGRNPATGDKIKIAASTVPTFKAGKSLKDKVNAKKGKKK